MPTQQIPAAPVVGGGAVSRRHAKLLHHLFENNGGASVNAPVKDLRLRRVVPPVSAPPVSVPPPDCSPDPPAAASKPVPAVQIQAQSTPPEPSAAAAAEDRERKPMLLPRSKLVRDPGSFGFRRLLPFLNQMAAKNGSDISDGKDAPSEPKASVSTNKELGRSDSGLADESVNGSQGGAVPVVDPVEPLAVKDAEDREMKDCSDIATEDPARSNPCVTRCTRSKFVHHPSSFSYKRMLPFVMENDISSQEEDRCKIRRVSEEEQIASDENDVLGNGHHALAISKGSPEERNGAEVGRVVEEVTSVSDGNCVGQIQSAVAEVSLDGGSTAEAQRVAQQEVLASVADPLSSSKGELASDKNVVLAGGQCQIAVSQDSPRERDVAGAETTDEKSVPMDFVEPLVAKAGGDQEMKDNCDGVNEQTKIVPGDLASSKPCLTRCTRSRLVHQRNSFSYKRMLPFLMENDVSSQEGDRAKLQRVPEEKQLTSDKSDVMVTGDHHLSTLKDSAEAAYGAEVERIVEEIASSPYENCLVKGGQLQSAVAEVSPDGSTAQVQKVTPDVVLSLEKDELSSDGDGVLPGGQCQLALSEDLPKESNVAEAERMVVEEKATKSDENSVHNDRDLQSAVSEVSQEGDTEKEATLKQVLASDGDEASGLTSDKGESLVKDRPQLCDSKKLFQENAELAELQQCRSSESGCSDVGFGSPTKAATVDVGADRHVAPEKQDSMASPDAILHDVEMISRPSDPCASDAPLSAEEVSGCLTQVESGLRKVGNLRPCGSPSLEKQCLSPKKLSPVNGGFSGVSCLKKRVLSPKKLSPKKGILKRPTNGCKGICMCLDCSIFRLRADRAFEFSRKQMQEADNIIGNLLEEVASLRSLAEKSSGRQEQIEEACQRASRVEEVARERQRQMQVELNSHCKIPGPRVKFAQYVEEKKASSPRGGSSSSRRQPLL